MSRPALTLLFLAFLAFFMGLGRMAITDADEAFYARASWEMVERGDWLTPHFNYEERWQKPVLYYWLTAAVYLVTGPTEWAARVWSALAGLGLVLLTWSMAARLTRREDAALLAGAIVATSFGCFALARMALPDLPLAFLITLGIWAALRAVEPPDEVDAGAGAGPRRAPPGARHVPDRSAGHAALETVVAPPSLTTRPTGVGRHALRWWAVGGLATGLGVLMKGPVALVVPALVLLPIWWRERSAMVLDARGIGAAAAIAIGIALPWYAAMWSVHGTEYLHSFFVGDNLERFATDRYNEPRGVFYYVPVLIGGLLPWSVFLLVLPWRPLAERLRTGWRLATTERRLLIWAAMPLLFYTASLGKQPRYILPVLPPLAILLALLIARRIQAAAAGQRPLALGLATWGTALLFALSAIVLARAQPLFIDAWPPVTWMGVGALIALALALGRIAATADWSRLPGALMIAAALLLVTVQFGALAGIRPAPVEEMAALVQTHRTAGEPAGTYNVFVRNLVFYTGIRQTQLFDEDGATAFVQSPERVLLVLRERDLVPLQSSAGVPLRRLGSVRYLDTAGIRLGTLLRPDAARHVEEVVLVTNR